MSESKRTRMFVDPQVQGRLLCRVVFYWCMAMVVIGGLAAIQVAMESRQAPFGVVANRTLLTFGPALIASLVLLPLILFDALRFSSKFAGPMHRLRREVKRLADGQSYEHIDFRKGDYWYDLAQEFNRLADRLERLEGSAKQSAPQPKEQDEVIPFAK